MARLPNVYINITDGNLGLMAPSAAGVFAKIGVSNKGQIGQIAALSDPDQVTEIFGTGPLASSLLDSFSNGCRTIYALRIEGDVAGTIGKVDASPQSSAQVTVTGSPLDAYQLRLEILTGGAPNTATFQYSLDGGKLYAQKLTVPSSGNYQIPDSGLEITFPAELQAGAIYEVKTTAPRASVAKIIEGMELLNSANLTFENVHIVGESSKPMWVAADVLMTEAESRYKFRYVTMESRYKAESESTNAWVQELVKERDGFASTRVQVVSAFGMVIDRQTGRQVLRNTAGHHRGEVATLKVQQSPGEVMEGPLSGIIQIMPADLNDAQILTLDTAGYTTIRTYEGMNGIYITNGRMMADTVSDFQHEEYRRVMDAACVQVRLAGLRFVKTGATESKLNALQAYLQHALDIMAGEGNFTLGRIVIPPDQDIIATSKLRVKIYIQPIGILREIELEIGLENPYLQAV